MKVNSSDKTAAPGLLYPNRCKTLGVLSGRLTIDYELTRSSVPQKVQFLPSVSAGASLEHLFEPQAEPPRKGVGPACIDTATELEKVGGGFFVPGVTVDELRQKGEQAELIDRLVNEMAHDLDVVKGVLSQANRIMEAEAHELLRRVRGQVKAQTAFDPSIDDWFPTVIEYFSFPKKARSKKDSNAA